jgi:predicted Zn-ribbon and HTH transcriptional regulator
MKTEYIDSEIERMTAYEKTNDLSNYGQKILNELRNVKKQLTLTDVVVPKETLPNNCKGCGRTIEEMGKMTSMCGVSACPNY